MTDLETTAALPVLATLETKTAAETRLLGQALAPFLKAGDLLILEGELGAGKTTFTQGLGAGLQVQQRVTSPTFIIARTHPVAPGSGLVPLVHVDAYRLQAGDDIESLDLDSALEDSIVVVEWGKGKAEGISPHTLMVEIARPETTLPPGSDFADIPEDTPCVLTFRASAGAWDLSGLPAAWEALVRQA
ncbi:hydrolase, P-loop family [Mobiluncus mulieris 28-1]|uniref:tRNA threonylcarbamoyladenosine biosynthesis protein TsaE n=2 Tax=Mobiluncus mulieris TaxID=2052 RepID=E0QTD4_9ACTO|nr:tRNA (adenosine(37)-N6)-threonylcarbamoyltransferase complex ATPase subunit type 1 TsaE [Mobiluncus mulieris]EEJ53580.1 hydrolase, P-loop family [Mobiluncus mulieris ATCC 35243]EEZ91400.1 hydrolase, P-loop family [Mobiluncus mulieris 28-1]EFM45171.1 hydrolase, P-loop family [Mobiluncus mulieris ATCC 35239]MBB5845445.1 tRNA threonylcarbamoyl adenosine modification protein YjeE [Mobiluncus mulieris]MCV0002604.1 tRNA (adenosine(37)-N6)-threonylcarbamoyltransferase complex ATPase subunit type 1